MIFETRSTVRLTTSFSRITNGKVQDVNILDEIFREAGVGHLIRNLHLVSRRHTLYSHCGIPAHYFFLRFCQTPLRPVLALNRSPGVTSAGGFPGARRLFALDPRWKGTASAVPQPVNQELGL